jgi:hypothetical protein
MPSSRPPRRFPWPAIIGIVILFVVVLLYFLPDLLPRRCIVEGTTVDTPAGPRPIEDLRPGDDVWCRGSDGSPRVGRVVRTLPARAWGYLRIRFSDDGVLCATKSHPIATPSGFVEAATLAPEMRVQGRDGLRTVASLESSSTLVKVYDLEVDPEPNFFAAGVLVHNKSTNERNASTSLKTLASAQADFRANDRDGNEINDFWVGDVAGLYCIEFKGEAIKLIELSVAAADIEPKTTLSKWANPSPKAAYHYAVIPYQADGKPYDTGNNRNTSMYAFCAFPAKGWNGKWVFIVNEENTILRKEFKSPQRIQRWPADPAAEGWTKLD